MNHSGLSEIKSEPKDPTFSKGGPHSMGFQLLHDIPLRRNFKVPTLSQREFNSVENYLYRTVRIQNNLVR